MGCFVGGSRSDGLKPLRCKGLKWSLLRSPFGAIEDWNELVIANGAIEDRQIVAVALRGDRGLELFVMRGMSAIRTSWLRSPFGAIEDWNVSDDDLCCLQGVLRSPFGAIEDWNSPCPRPSRRSTALRSPFGAIEDWNQRLEIDPVWQRVAVALRGDRGLEPETDFEPNPFSLRSPFGAIEDWNAGLRETSPVLALVAVALRGDRGLEQSSPRFQCPNRAVGCGRPSGRSRIGTLLLLSPNSGAKLRSPFGAIEDWNN